MIGLSNTDLITMNDLRHDIEGWYNDESMTRLEACRRIERYDQDADGSYRVRITELGHFALRILPSILVILGLVSGCSSRDFESGHRSRYPDEIDLRAECNPSHDDYCVCQSDDDCGRGCYMHRVCIMNGCQNSAGDCQVTR